MCKLFGRRILRCTLRIVSAILPRSPNWVCDLKFGPFLVRMRVSISFCYQSVCFLLIIFNFGFFQNIFVNHFVITHFFACDFSPIILILFFCAANIPVFSTNFVKNTCCTCIFHMFYIIMCSIKTTIHEFSCLLYCTFYVCLCILLMPLFLFLIKDIFWIDLSPPTLCL